MQDLAPPVAANGSVAATHAPSIQIDARGLDRLEVPQDHCSADVATSADLPPSAGAGEGTHRMHGDHAPGGRGRLAVRVRSMATVSSAASMTSMHSPGGNDQFTDAASHHGSLGGVRAASFVKEDCRVPSESSDTSESPVRMHEQPEVRTPPS